MAETTGNSSWERSVAERLGSIEAKLDGIVDRLDTGHALHIDYGKRIGALERWKAYILGVLAMISLGLLLLFKVM